MKWIVRVGVSVLSLLLIWVILLSTQIFPLKTKNQQKALAQLQLSAPSSLLKKNAFVKLYSLDYKMSDSEREKILARDVAAFKSLVDFGYGETQFVSELGKHQAKYSINEDVDLVLCGEQVSDCLEKTKKNMSTVRKLLEHARPQLAAFESNYDADHLWNPFEPRSDTPLKLGGSKVYRYVLSRSALAFVDGNFAYAMNSLCQHSQFWREMRKSNNTLIIDMIAVSYLSLSARLFGEMIAKLPAEIRIPLACTNSMRPLDIRETSQCKAIAHELEIFNHSIRFGVMFGAQKKSKTFRHNLGVRITSASFNPDHVIARFAESIVKYCKEATTKEDRFHAIEQKSRIGCNLYERIFNSFGCAFVLSSPFVSFDKFALRVLDLDGQLILLNAAIWMRENRQDFANRPIHLIDRLHDCDSNNTNRILRVKNLDVSRAEWWDIPMPNFTGG